ncbi:hypothetical protein ACI514_22575 [Pseudomonas sp. M20]|uniref:hypothetical protein n=1 Tax=Pseudomonas sp. M20 TaxID=3379129 RepID=UPI00386D44AA
MATKTPVRGTVSVDVHTRPNQTPETRTPHLDSTISVGTSRDGQPARSGNVAPDNDLDAISPAPAIKIQPATPHAENQISVQQPIEHYRMAASATLPAIDASGFRTYKGRRYVDMADGGIVLVTVDADTGRYRARLASERLPSGPVLLRDADSGLWRVAEDHHVISVPLTDPDLRTFRSDLDFSTSEPDSDGVFRHDGKRYALIDGHAYQVMLDTDASTPVQKVWRIVNAKDSVATDSENIYHASRSGESHAITRDGQDTWAFAASGLRGGMRRGERPGAGTQASLATLLHDYAPFAAVHKELVESSERYNSLYREARALPTDSSAQTAALIAVEVHLLKHIKKQADFIQSLVDNKDWLVRLKARGEFKKELHTFRMDRVSYLNRLMTVMDLKLAPTFATLNSDNCKKMIANLNKKLKILEDREVLMGQIRKASPGAEPDLVELSQEVPTAERVTFNKLSLYVHLFAGTPDHTPNATMHSLPSINLFNGDLHNIPEGSQPLALMLTLDQIRRDKSRFEAWLSTDSVKAEYAREILALTDTVENRIETRLNELLATFDRNTELPSRDQDIDFDFLPVQPGNSGTTRPATPRKVFSTRRHGTSRILVGETETAADGSVIIKVSNPLQPDGPTERYEKRQGEWLPVRPPIVSTPRPELIAEANRLLADVEKHIAAARAKETAKDNPTEIIEDLEKAIEPLNEQARRLQNHENAAEDSEIQSLAERLQTAADTLSAHGQSVLVRMYKNKDVLDILRLNYLIDHAELNAVKTVDRKQQGKGRDKSFLDVYSIRDRVDNAPLWEAHFHYDKDNSEPLNFTIRGSHLKTLEQSKRGIESQRRDEQAGLPHVAIWRQTFDGKTARKIFALASEATAAVR